MREMEELIPLIGGSVADNEMHGDAGNETLIGEYFQIMIWLMVKAIAN